MSGILFACIHTAISACVLIFLGRSTANSYRPVRPTCLPALANSFFSLMARATTTSVQMMWMYVSAASLSDGLMDEQRGSWLYFRLLLTWALLLTLGGSAATVHLLSWREMLAQPSHPFGEGATGAPRLCSGRWCRGAATELILLCERVLSFVTAWAWTDVFFAWGAQPSGWLTVKDIGIAVTLTLVTILWLASVGGSLAVNAAFERSQIESFFVAHSASFFVGWSWWKVLRDLAAISGRAALPTSLASPHDIDRVREKLNNVGLNDEALYAYVHEAESRELAGALLGNVLFGPVLTVIMIWAKHFLLPRLVTQAGVDTPRSASPATHMRRDRTLSFLMPDRARAKPDVVLL